MCDGRGRGKREGCSEGMVVVTPYIDKKPWSRKIGTYS